MNASAISRRPAHSVHALGALVARFGQVTRRDLQVALGLLWVLDGALQAQPFMFSGGFASQVIAPVGSGQPGPVSGPVHWAATLVAANPVVWNALAVAIQLALGVGLLLPRTARLTLAASIGWAIGVWYIGEGLSGLASGHASLLTGAPGSALMYAILAAAAWPRGDSRRELPARWLAPAWAVLWVGAALFQLLPGQNTGAALSSAMTGGAASAPHWLAQLDASVGTWASHHGLLAVILLAAVEILVGLGALLHKTRTLAVTTGLALSAAIWIVGQNFGQLYSGRATDPNSAPLFMLMAVAMLAWSRRSARQGLAPVQPRRGTSYTSDPSQGDDNSRVSAKSAARR
jgi:hypothetical protein